MKKIIIAAFTMLTIGATQADYTLKYPLEQAKGGSHSKWFYKYKKSNNS